MALMLMGVGMDIDRRSESKSGSVDIIMNKLSLSAFVFDNRFGQRVVFHCCGFSSSYTIRMVIRSFMFHSNNYVLW